MKIQSTFLKYFPTPKFLDIPHVGVDISSSSHIRIAEVIKGSKGFKFGTHDEIALASPINWNISLSNQKELVNELKKLQKKHKLLFVEVSVPEEKSYIFTIEVPAGENDQIRNYIEFHLEENVPISLEEAVFDFQLLKKEKAEKWQATVSVVPRTFSEDLINLFSSCGMEILSCLTENQALSRAVIKQGDMSTNLLVNLGLNKSVISVAYEDSVQFTSTVNIGSQDFISAVMKEFNVSSEEAEKIISEQGFTKTKEKNEILLSMINAVSALKDEISKVYTYWQSYHQKSTEAGITGGDINKIILVGRGTSIMGFRDYLATSVKAEVEIANVWINIFNFENEIPQIEYKDSLDYGIAIGLSMPKNI